MTFGKWLLIMMGGLLLLAGCTAPPPPEDPVGTAQSALVSVTWTDVLGASAFGNSLSKTGAAGWNAGATSNEALGGDGFVQLQTGENTTDKVAGLSHTDPAGNFATIDFGFYLSSGQSVSVYEDGASVSASWSYTVSDVFQIQVAGSQVTYLQNGIVRYTSHKIPTFPLRVGVALDSPGATVTGVGVSPGYWQDAVGVTTTFDNMTKTAATGWNAGAATATTLNGDGYGQFTTAETTTDKMVGLSHADPAQNPGAVDFGFYLSSSGWVNVYEDGAAAGSFGSYAAGDVFRIQVTGTQVTYLQNGNLLYTSSKTPTFPLLVGAALYTSGATVDNLVVVPTYWRDVLGVSAVGEDLTKTGATGFNAGAATQATLGGDGYTQFTTAEATTDKMAGLSHTDPAGNYDNIDFALYLSSGGGVNVYENGFPIVSAGAYAAGDVFRVQVEGTVVTYLKNGSVLYTSTKAPTFPLLFGAVMDSTGATVNDVVVVQTDWQDLIGVTTSGASMTKTAATGWNAGAASVASFPGDGFAQFTTAEATTDKMAGLCHADPAGNYAAIDFGLYLSSGGGVNVYEDGSYAGYFGSYAANDVFRIQVAGAQVTYLQNGNVLYTSTRAPAHPLLLGTALYTSGATIDNAVVDAYWQDVVGVSTSGPSMTKTAATGWNAGAASVPSLSAGGYAQFTTAEASTDKMAGLSHADPAQSPSAIDFGFYLSSSGSVNVYEDGAFKGTFGTYAAGDALELWVAGTQVIYAKNGSVLYTSGKTPTFPLLLGTALYTTGATLQNVAVTSCAAGYGGCGGACVDIQTDTSNCGGCGHSCVGGACNAGVCGPATLASAPSYGAIAVDATSVYWDDLNSGKIMKVPLAGGTPTTLATGQSADGMTIDASDVYWTDITGGQLLKTPKTGGASTVLAYGLSLPSAVAVDPSYVYFTTNGDGVLHRVPIAGGALLTLGAGHSYPFGVAVDATDVFWLDSAGGLVKAVPVTGGLAVNLATGPSGPYGVATDGVNVYWTNYFSGTVMQVPVSGGTPITLASGLATPQGIAVDATHVYVAVEGSGTTNDGWVIKVPIGGGTVVTIAPKQFSPFGITVDGVAVYWTSASGNVVMRAGK